jgi:hypothetical protein
MQALPYDLVRQFPPAPRGTRYIYDDDQILLVNVNTRVVLDFINISISQPAPPRTVNRMPSYEEQHPSDTHQPPSHSRAYEVAQGKPFTDDEHPSTHGQGHDGNRGKPDMDEDHPSSQAQDHRKNKGKPDMRDDHPSQHAKNDLEHGQQSDQGKPLWEDKSSSDHGKKTKKHQDGEPIHEVDLQPSKSKGKHGEQKGGPPEDKGRPSDHAKVDKDYQGGPKGGSQKNKDHPSKDKGKPSMDRRMAEDSGSHEMDSKGKPKGKGNQRETFADSSEQKDSSMQSSSPRKGKGKPSKQDRNSSRGPSGRENTEQFQPNSTSEENIQVAKIEKDRGKGSSKGPGRTQKIKRGQREQQAEIKAALTQQEPAPSMAPSQPTTTASISPSVFDNNQRSIIQSYFQKSGSKKSGKGRGKKSKRNKTSFVAKNDILTQPTEPLPQNLESQLPPSPPNTHRAIYNQQVVLIEQGTNRVLDVINVSN